MLRITLSFLIPQQDHLIKRIYSRNPQVPSTLTEVPKLSSLVGVRYPYQIIFTYVLNIPIPHPVAHLPDISMFIRVSLFDMEQCCFFGKTWQSPLPCWSKNQEVPRERNRSDSDESEEEEQTQLTGSRLKIRLANQVY